MFKSEWKLKSKRKKGYFCWLGSIFTQLKKICRVNEQKWEKFKIF